MRDALAARLLRLSMHLFSNAGAWRAYQIQRQWWTSETGTALIRTMEHRR